MSPERWRQVEALYHSALESEPAQRSAFLIRACNGDEGLRREVESLLEQPTGDGLLARPVWENAGEELELTATQIVPGAQFGPYRIEAPLGAGGMGKVFRGRDTRLGRAVAIKVIDEKFSERFEREARAISALNHPHICTLYDVGPNYLVMEVCDGETLAARLRRGKLSLQETVRYGAKIAEALSAAHAQGIVHRDLKPGNIMISKSGVKVLDFGLAKSQHDVTVTATNAVMGTPAYMAPEQLAGRECDARTDLYSLGLVLYEMASGKRAEQGQTPPMEHLPEKLAHVIERCIAPEPEDRWQSTADLCRELQWIESRSTEVPPSSHGVTPGKLRERLSWGTAAALAGGLALFAFLHFREAPSPTAAPLRFQIQLSENTIGYPVVSPDGRKVVYLSGGRLWVLSLESGESRDLTDAIIATPFWSPDSRFIGYLSDRVTLKKIEARGGPAQTVTDLPGDSLWGGGAWNQDDKIIFGDRPVGLFRVPASGGIPVQVTALDSAHHENAQFSPAFLPDGRHFVYFRLSPEEGKSAIYIGSLDSKPKEQTSQALVASNSQPVYAPSADPRTGYLLFVRGVTLMAQRFDNRQLELKGQAEPIAEQVKPIRPSASNVVFSASANVLLLPRRFVQSQLGWHDREGKLMGTVGEPGGYGSLELSPDGTRLAGVMNSAAADTGNIWLLDLARGGASTRFTFGSLIDIDPVWSPDGGRIIFSSNRDGIFNLYQKAANGVKDEEVLLKSSQHKFPTSWSRDGRFLLYTVVDPKTKGDLWVLLLENDKKSLPFLSTGFDELQARFSPDGHWVAYTSDESGHDEVYVRSFSLNAAGTAAEEGAKWQISNGFGSYPHWRGDGRELYYQSRDGGIMAVEIETRPAFRAGSPKPLGISTSESWASAADGSRFLKQTSKEGPRSNTVVLNWQTGLKK